MQCRILPVVSFAFLLAATVLEAAEFHVSPTGSNGGDGSAEQPWNLRTALEHPAAIQPGDTLWLHAGTYQGRFTSRLTGTKEAPIVVRQAPGEHATIDGCLFIRGPWNTYRDFEVMSTRPAETTEEDGLNAGSPGCKFINMLVHDATNSGIGFWSQAPDSEIYGCLIYYNGRETVTKRPYAYGVYAQNQTGTKRIVDNFIFKSYGGWGIHAYTEGGYLNNFRIEGNVLFDNGAVGAGYDRNLHIGGGRVAESPEFIDNYTYYSYATQPSGGYNSLAYGKGVNNMIVQGNYLIAEKGTALELKGRHPNTAMTGNTLLGMISGFSPNDFPDNAYLPARPTGVKVIVRPNAYERGRANICVYNWDGKNSVVVDVSSVKGLAKGDRYEVRDVQNWFGPPAAAGTYVGEPISLPMTLTEVAPTVAAAAKAPVHTSSEFGAFVLLKRE